MSRLFGTDTVNESFKSSDDINHSALKQKKSSPLKKIIQQLVRPAKEIRATDRLHFESLEPRILLSADLTYGGTTYADPLTLLVESNVGVHTFRLMDGMTEVSSADLGVGPNPNQVNILGSEGDDSLIIDESVLLLSESGTDFSINFNGNDSGLSASDDTIIIEDDADFVLTDAAITVDAGATSQIINLTGVDAAQITGGLSYNTFDVSDWTKAADLDGSSSSSGANEIILSRGGDVTLGDGSLQVDASPLITLADFTRAVITGDGSDNTYDMSAWTGTADLDGGAGSLDTLVYDGANKDISLSDLFLDPDGITYFDLAGIEIADLSGDSGNNTFDLTGWSGDGNIDGGGAVGADTLKYEGADAQQTLSDGSFATSGGIDMVLTGISDAELIGTSAATDFDLTGWTGTGKLEGQGAGDSLTYSGDDATMTLTDTGFSTSAGINMVLDGVGSANLEGGASDNEVTLSSWTGTGDIKGGAGNDSLIYAGGDTLMELSDTGFSASAGPNMTLASVENAELTGDGGSNEFDISGWTGTGDIDGQNGSDTLVVSDDADLNLNSGNVVLSSGASMTLNSIENAEYTGGASDNLIRVDQFQGDESTSTIDLLGLGGDDAMRVIIPVAGPDATYTINGGTHSITGDRLVLDAQYQDTSYDLLAQQIIIDSATINYSNLEFLDILNPDLEIDENSYNQYIQGLEDLAAWSETVQSNDELYDVIPFIDRSLADIIEPTAVIQQFTGDIVAAVQALELQKKQDWIVSQGLLGIFIGVDDAPYQVITSLEIVDIINSWSTTLVIAPVTDETDPDFDPLNLDKGVVLGEINIGITQLATNKLRLLPDGPALLFDFGIGSQRDSQFDLSRSAILGDYGIDLDPDNKDNVMGDVNVFMRSGLNFDMELGIDNFNEGNASHFAKGHTLAFTGQLNGAISGATSVDLLNNGQGLDVGGTAPHLRINRTDGSFVDVDLSGVSTVQDIINTIDTATGVTGFAGINTEGNGLKLIDVAGDQTLSVEALNSSEVAAQLGLLGDTYRDGTGDTVIEGRAIGLQLTIEDADADPATVDANIGFVGGEITDGQVAIHFATTLNLSDPTSGDKGVDSADYSTGILDDVTQSGALYMHLPVFIEGDDFAGSGNADITGTITIGDNSANYFATPQEAVFSSQELQNFTHVTASEAFLLLAQVAGSMQQIDSSALFEVAVPFVKFGITEDTLLASFNEGIGIATTGDGNDDLRVELRDTNTYDLDLDSYTTVGELLAAFNSISGLSAEINERGTGFNLTDDSADAGGTFSVSSLPVGDSSSQAALGLGLAIGAQDREIKGTNVAPGGSLALNDVAFFGTMMKTLVASLVTRSNDVAALSYHNLQGLALDLGATLGTTVEPIYDAAEQTVSFRVTGSMANSLLVSAPVNLESEGEDSLGELDVISTTGLGGESPASMDIDTTVSMDLIIGFDLAANIAANLGLPDFDPAALVDGDVDSIPGKINIPDDGILGSDSKFNLVVNGVAVEVNLDQGLGGRDQVVKDDYVLLANNMVFDPLLTKDATIQIGINGGALTDVTLKRGVTTGTDASFGTDFTPLSSSNEVLFDLGFRPQQQIFGDGMIELIAQELPDFLGSTGELVDQDFNFLLTLDKADGNGVSIYLIELTQANTAGNTTIAQLVGDLGTALSNATLLDADLQVDTTGVDLSSDISVAVNSDGHLYFSHNVNVGVVSGNALGMLRIDSAAAFYANRDVNDLLLDLNQAMADAGLDSQLQFVLRDVVDANGVAMEDRLGNALQKLAIEVIDGSITDLNIVVADNDGAHETLGFGGDVLPIAIVTAANATITDTTAELTGTDASLNSADGYYDGMTVVFTSGDLKGQQRTIETYTIDGSNNFSFKLNHGFANTGNLTNVEFRVEDREGAKQDIQYESYSSVYKDVVEVLQSDLQTAINAALIGVTIPNVTAAADEIIQVQLDGKRLSLRSVVDAGGVPVVETMRILAHEDADARDASGNLLDPIFSELGFISGMFARSVTTQVYLDEADSATDDLLLEISIGGGGSNNIGSVLANYGYLGLEAEGYLDVAGSVSIDFNSLGDSSGNRLELVDLLTNLERDQFFNVATAQTTGNADVELNNVTAQGGFIDLTQSSHDVNLSLGNWVPNHTQALEVLADNPLSGNVLNLGQLTYTVEAGEDPADVVAAELQIQVNQDVTVGLFLTAADVADNTSLSELIDDLNAALAITHDGVQFFDLTESMVFDTVVIGSDTHIVLKSILPTDTSLKMVESLSVAVDESSTTSELGFAGVKQVPSRHVDVQIDNLSDFDEFTLVNTATFTDAIARVAQDFLARAGLAEDGNGIQLMQEKLPMLGIEADDLLDYSSVFQQRLAELQSGEYANIQELRQAFIGVFSFLNDTNSTADISAANYLTDKQILIDIDGFHADASQQSTPLNVSLGQMLLMMDFNDPQVLAAVEGLLVEKVSGFSAGGTNQSITVVANQFSEQNGFFNGMLVELVGSGEIRLISDYAVTGSIAVFNLADAFSTAVGTGDEFRVLAPVQSLTSTGIGALSLRASALVDIAMGVDLSGDPQAYISTDAADTALTWDIDAASLQPTGQNAVNPQINVGPLTVYGLAPENLFDASGEITLASTNATENLDGTTLDGAVSVSGQVHSRMPLAFPSVADPYESTDGTVQSSSSDNVVVYGDLLDVADTYDNWVIEFTSGNHAGERYNVIDHLYDNIQFGTPRVHTLVLDSNFTNSVSGEFILINPLRVSISDVGTFLEKQNEYEAYQQDPLQGYSATSVVSLHSPDLATLIADSLPYKQLANSENIIEGLDLLFVTLQDAMADMTFQGSLPVIGDGLADLDPFLADLRVDLLNRLVDLLEDPSLVSLVADHLVDAERLMTAFEDAFDGNTNSATLDGGIILSASKAGVSVDINDEGKYKEADDINFQTTLHQELTIYDIDSMFDIGDSLRSLNLLLDDTPLTLHLGFDINLDFGLSADAGFYVNTSSMNEMQINMEFTLSDPPPGQDAHVGLLSDIPVNIKDEVYKAWGSEATTGTISNDQQVITLTDDGLNIPGTTIGNVLPGETAEDGTLTGFLSSVPTDGSYRLRMVDSSGNEEFRDIIDVDSSAGTVTVSGGFNDSYAADDWYIGPQPSKASYLFEYDLKDPEGTDGKLSRADMVSGAAASELLDGAVTGIVNLQLDVKSMRFDQFLSAPQLRSDVNVYWEMIDRPLIAADADGNNFELADQTIGLGPYAFGDSDALPSANITKVTDSNQLITGNLQTADKGNIINAPIIIEFDSGIDPQDGDIVRIAGVTGFHPVPVKTNGIFTISNVDRGSDALYPEGGDNTFTLDGTLGEDVMWSGEFAFVGAFESMWNDGSGQVYILPKVSAISSESGSGDLVLELDRVVSFAEGDQITVNNVWAGGNNGVYTVVLTGNSQQIKLKDINGTMISGSGKTLDDSGFGAYIDSANPATITYDNVQMNLDSVVGDFLSGALGNFRDSIGEMDWLLSPTKGWLFKHDPIFSFLKGEDVQVIDTIKDIALQAALSGSGAIRYAGISTYITLEIIDLLSPIYGLAERLSDAEPTGEEYWVNIGGISLPDIRGVAEIASLLNPQGTPIPVGVSTEATNTLAYDTDQLKPTELQKKNSSSNDGGVDFIQSKYSLSHQNTRLTAAGVSNNIDDALGTAKEDRKTGLQQKASGFGVSFEGDIELDFPILSKPDQALRFLLGANVDLFTLDLPKVQFDLSFELTFLVNPVPPVTVSVLFGLGLGLDFAFGMDTQGYREYGRSGNESDIANGWFALDVREFQQSFLTSGEFTPQTYEADKTGLTMDDPDELSITPSVAFELAVGLGKFLQVGVGGGIEGYVNFNWYDPDSDGRIRGRELEASKWVIGSSGELEENISAVWDISGGMTWSFYVFVDLLGARIVEFDPFETAGINQTIFEFTVVFNRVPLLGTDIGGDVLRLNTGAFVTDQIHGDLVDGDDKFRVSIENDRIKVEQELNNVWITDARFFTNDPIFGVDYVQKIIAFGGEGDDTFTVLGDMGDIIVEFHGGVGDDTLEGNASVEILFGDEGDDTLSGGGGDDTLYGGTGNDTLDGEGGNDVLFGEEDDDEIYGGSGNDHIYGDTGNDLLLGESGSDIYFFAPRWGDDEVTETDIGEWDTWNFERVRDSITVNFDVGLTEAYDLHNNRVTHNDSLIEKIKGSFGADQLIVSASSGLGIDLDGRNGSDQYIVNMGSDLTANIRVKDSGYRWYQDTLIVNGTSGDDTVGITDQEVLLGDPVTAAIFVGEDAGIETLIANMDEGDDSVYLYSTLETMSVNIFGEGGDDVVVAGNGPALTTATLLADLGNTGGMDINAGGDEFIVTTSNGLTVNVDLDTIASDAGLAGTDDLTLGDLMNWFTNYRDASAPSTQLLQLDINADSDGLVLTGLAAGSGRLSIQAADEGGGVLNQTATLLGLTQLRDESTLTISTTQNPAQVVLEVANGGTFTRTRSGSDTTVTVSEGTSIDLQAGDIITVGGQSMTLAAGDTILSLAPDAFITTDSTKVVPESGSVTWTVAADEVLTFDHADTVTFDDGINDPLTFEFTTDDHVLRDDAVKVKIDAGDSRAKIIDRLLEELQDEIEDNRIDLEYKLLSDGNVMITTPAGSSSAPITTNNSDVFGSLLTTVIEGDHIYDRRPGGTLDDLHGSGFVGPILIHGGADTDHDVLILDDSADTDNNSGVMNERFISGLGIGQGIVYQQMEVVDVRLGQGNDDFLVTQTAKNSISSVSGGGGSDNITASLAKRLNINPDDLLLIDGVEQDTTAGATLTFTAGQKVINEAGEFVELKAGDLVRTSSGVEKQIEDGVDTDVDLAGGGSIELLSLTPPEELGALVLYGDYPVNPEDTLSDPGTGQFDWDFDYPALGTVGDDVIDGEESLLSLIAYGGAGDDTLLGSSDGDWLLGGSGDDILAGQSGDDRIWGDSGVDVYLKEYITYALRDGGDIDATQLVDGGSLERGIFVNVDADGGTDSLGNVTDDGTTGMDLINGSIGDDIIIGDQGQIFTSNGQFDATQSQISNDGYSGADDEIYGDEGDDIILAGLGDDIVRGNDGNDVILGDNGTLDYNMVGGDGDLNTLDSIVASVDDLGGADDIEGNLGMDTILGGQDADVITGNEDEDILIGDNAEIFMRTTDGRRVIQDSGVASIETTDIGNSTGGDDQISGDDAQDIIIGGAGGDQLTGNDADDLILGDNGLLDYDADGDLSDLDEINTVENASIGGDDTIAGNAGADTLIGGTGIDQMYGDSLIITDAAADSGDIMVGDNATINLRGDAAQRQIQGDGIMDITTTDVLDSTGGDDEMYGHSGDDIMLGGAGGDVIEGNTGDDIIIGDNGSLDYDGDGDLTYLDEIDTEENQNLGGVDTISGNAGADTILGGTAGDILYGDAAASATPLDDGADNILGDNGTIRLRGDVGQRTIQGNAIVGIDANDGLDVSGGDDTIIGHLGDDIILGGTGGDTVTGSLGNDVILGDNGELDYDVDADLSGLDEVRSEVNGSLGGDDDIQGNDGNDLIIGGTAADMISGNAGDDIILGDNALVNTGVATGSERRNVLGNAVEDISTTDTANDTGGSDTISGNADNDIIVGGIHADDLSGNDGDDLIVGDNVTLDFIVDTDTDDLDRIDTLESNTLGDVDTISGDAGADTIIGGTAGDFLEGNGGEDVVIGDNATINLRLDAVNGRRMVQGDSIEDITTTDTAEDTGGVDIMSGDDNDDILIGGVNGDSITGNAGDDLVLGDNGTLDFDVDADLTSLDLIDSLVSDTLGGVDAIDGNAGADAIIGGTAGDTIYGDVSNSTDPAADAGDIIVGDNARIDLFDHTGERLIENSAVMRIDTTDELTNTGGSDTIFGDTGDDLIAGGVQGDTIRGGTEDDHILGDNGIFDWDYQTHDGKVNDPAITINLETVRDLNTLDLVTTEMPTAQPGGRDTIHGDDGSDVIFGGTDSDELHGDSGDETGAVDNNDLMFGDHGRLFPQHGAATEVHSRNFFAIDTATTDGGDGDEMYGEEGSDIMLGQQGDDRMFGGSENDDMIGGHNVIGGMDEMDVVDTSINSSIDAVAIDLNSGIPAQDVNDVMDGDSGDDAMAGDNAQIWRNDDSRSPRYQSLDGATLYKDVVMAEGFIAEEANINSIDQSDPDPDAVGRSIEVLDHDASIEAISSGARPWGDDVMAGGVDADLVFGELGDDLVQGDGSIDLTDDGLDGPTTQIDTTDEVIPGVGGTLFFNVAENAADGDDYIEGNGGDDILFGGLGQDDIIGGSSLLFGLSDANDHDSRPDGSDLIYGGAATPDRMLRNAETDPNDLIISPENAHALDADVIMGDNANIYRAVIDNGDGTTDYHEFNYDEVFGGERTVPRATDTIDYTLGGIDVNPVSHANDQGAYDVIHGESGDDIVYGQRGRDIIFGESEDDNIIGGYDHDWISGGTGQDGVLGDDGRIHTSRNSRAGEALHGIDGFSQTELDEFIKTPGSIQQATININGALKKTVNLTPFFLDPEQFDVYADPTEADDIIYGGWGSDFLHGGGGDDAISGAEALQEFYDNPVNNGDVLGFASDPQRPNEFADYDEYNPRDKIAGFLLNFDETEGHGDYIDPERGLSSDKVSDGDDIIFGDLGNDWIVGGTGRDNVYGGYGSDLLNMDDDHSTNLEANDQPDTDISYEDRAYGGAGRDVLIGNTGGDRLIDWVGEYNSYIVPFAPFGTATVSRTLQPQLQDFLYALSANHGADNTRGTDPDGGVLERNGEPYGELGVVLQKDFDWKDQTGAPDDPQAGNIPGGKRDVLRSAAFNNGRMDGFSTDSGVWAVENGKLSVSAESKGGDAVSVYHVDSVLPSYYEIQAAVTAGKPTGGWKSNSYIIFDYQSETDFKFAGVNASTDKLQMGHRTADGWIVDVQTPAQIKPNTEYNLLVAVNGTNVTLIVDGSEVFSHTFTARVVDGITFGLNTGMVGMGSDNSKGTFDNVRVQKLPPAITFSDVEDFSDGIADRYTETNGSWVIDTARYNASAPADGSAALSLTSLPMSPASILEFEAVLNTDGTAGIVLDYVGPDNFKFVAMDVVNQQIVVGHHAKKGWVIDASIDHALQAGTDYSLKASLFGGTISVLLDGEVVLGNIFFSILNDGQVGAMVSSGNASFDQLTLQTDDLAYLDQNGADTLLADGMGDTAAGEILSYTQLQTIAEEAVIRLFASGLYSADDLLRLEHLSFRIADLPDNILGKVVGNNVFIDSNAARYGWFVGNGDNADEQFMSRLEDGTLVASAGSDANSRMDLLSVVQHELGHVLGLEHDGHEDTYMATVLKPGQRIIEGDTPSPETTVQVPLPVEDESTMDLSSLVMAMPEQGLRSLQSVLTHIDVGLINAVGRAGPQLPMVAEPAISAEARNNQAMTWQPAHPHPDSATSLVFDENSGLLRAHSIQVQPPTPANESMAEVLAFPESEDLQQDQDSDWLVVSDSDKQSSVEQVAMAQTGPVSNSETADKSSIIKWMEDKAELVSFVSAVGTVALGQDLHRRHKKKK